MLIGRRSVGRIAIGYWATPDTLWQQHKLAIRPEGDTGSDPCSYCYVARGNVKICIALQSCTVYIATIHLDSLYNSFEIKTIEGFFSEEGEGATLLKYVYSVEFECIRVVA